MTARFFSHQAATGLHKPWQGAGILTFHAGDIYLWGHPDTLPQAAQESQPAFKPLWLRAAARVWQFQQHQCCSTHCPNVPSSPSSSALLHTQQDPEHPISGLGPKRVLSLPHPEACGEASTGVVPLPSILQIHPLGHWAGCVCSP